MKRFFSVYMLLIPFIIQAQSISEGISTLVYSLPRTQLIFNISYNKITEQPGPFYQYSEIYLATNKVITKERTYYELKNIDVEEKTLPDPERTFTIIPAKKSLASAITVNKDGILCGINVSPVNIEKDIKIEKETSNNTSTQKLLPLGEDYMLAGSVAKMAEGTAKQIYSIRENRADLLSGQADNMPADGASLKALINEMDKQEKELTELFTGRTTVESLSNSINVFPDKTDSVSVIFRFSTSAGIVPKDDLSGEPIYLSIHYNPINAVSNENDKKKKKDVEIFSVLPVTAQIKLSNSSTVFVQKEVVLPQFGALIPVPLETMSKTSKAYINPETGRLLSIQDSEK